MTHTEHRILIMHEYLNKLFKFCVIIIRDKLVFMLKTHHSDFGSRDYIAKGMLTVWFH